MKNIIVALTLIIATTLQAQEKVKGNREPSTVITAIEDFKTIEIGGDYEVAIVRGSTAQIEITTDSNLHQYLRPTVINGLLTISSTANIRSKKELKIRLIYPGDLGSIIVKDKAELSTITDYEAAALTIEVRDDAKIFITAKVDDLTLTMKDGCKGEINFKGNKATVTLDNKASLKALLDYDEATITMADRADARIDGDMKNATMNLKDRADLKSSNLLVNDLNLIISNNASAAINAKNKLSLKSSGDGKTELHNTPKITIEEFSGSSVLSKK